MLSYIHWRKNVYVWNRWSFVKALKTNPKPITKVHSYIYTVTFQAMVLYIFIAQCTKFRASTICQPFNIWVSFSSSILMHPSPQNISLLYAEGTIALGGPDISSPRFFKTTAPTSSSLVKTSGLLCHCRRAEFLQPVYLSDFDTKTHIQAYKHMHVLKHIQKGR